MRGQSHRLDAAHRLALADDALDVLHLGDVDFARLLALEELVHRRVGERLDASRPTDARVALEPPRKSR